MVPLVAGHPEVGDRSIEANRLGLGRRLPLCGAKENADVRGTDFGDARRDGLGFHGVIDGAEDDGVTRDMDDDAAAGKIGDDFVFLGAGLGRGKGQHT